MAQLSKFLTLFVLVSTLLAWNGITTGETSNRSKERSILAVFAHPDDEFTIAPILSKFAERGCRCSYESFTIILLLGCNTELR